MAFVYVASPYSDPDAGVRGLRAQAVARFLVERMLAEPGRCLYSPIVHGHVLDREARKARTPLPNESAWWRPFNYAMLHEAAELWVLRLEGWEYSTGVGEEIAFARACGIPVRYVDP